MRFASTGAQCMSPLADSTISRLLVLVLAWQWRIYGVFFLLSFCFRWFGMRSVSPTRRGTGCCWSSSRSAWRSTGGRSTRRTGAAPSCGRPSPRARQSSPASAQPWASRPCTLDRLVSGSTNGCKRGIAWLDQKMEVEFLWNCANWRWKKRKI